jgi:uncharacterized protein (TIGR02266 family)
MPSITDRGRYQTLARLFEMVDGLSETQQILLLKRLTKNLLSAHLFKLIIELNEEEQSQLLDQLEEITSTEIPEKTIDLDEREHPRKSCLIAVDYTSQDRTFSDYVLDISASGVFIETGQSLTVGQPLSIRFSFPDEDDPLIVGGEVVWSSPKGIGVKFYGLDPSQQTRIKKFILQF